MSSNYTRVFRQPEAAKSYGYGKVSREELRTIVMRVQKPTHASEQASQFPDGYFKHPIRLTSGYCDRARADSAASRPEFSRRRGMSPKALKAVVRRLQTPTLSRDVANGWIVPDRDVGPPPAAPPPRPKNGDENEKFLRRITRPTRSSKRRDLDAFWREAENSRYYYTDFSEQPTLGKDEIASIVQRVSTPTVASEPTDGRTCPKLRPDARIDRDKLPLVSGLSRSKRVDDIVNRLYRPSTAASGKMYYSTAAY